MRFLAPFQYVAFKLPFYIPYQSGALIYTTFCNMATPRTLIVILLLNLQALYNVIILFFIRRIARKEISLSFLGRAVSPPAKQG